MRVFALVFVLILTLVAASSAMAQDSTFPYDFTLTAFCDVTQTQVSVPIWMDGNWTQYRTPYTFTGLVGHHQFNVPIEDEHGHFVYPLIPPGSGTDVSEAWSFQFEYRATPSLWEMTGSIYVGSTTQVSFLLGISENTTQSSISYRIEGPEYNSQVSSSIIDQGNLTIAGSLFTINVTVPQDAHVGSYSFKVDGVTRGISWRNYSETSEQGIDVLPMLLNPRAYEPLPKVSKFTAGSLEYNYYENPYTHAAVIYVGGGGLGGSIGSSEIHGCCAVGELNSGSYRLVYNLVINGFSVASPSGDWDGVDFPAQAANYLMSQGKTDIYMIGFSAGGIVAASQIINYPTLYKKAVISDAILTKESGFKGDLAPKAGQVITPHCLIWGEADYEAPFRDAEAWLANVNPGLAQLHVYSYYHDWFNTGPEPTIIETIINFLSGKTLLSQASTYTFHVRTNGAISNAAYDGQHLTFNIEKPQAGDDVFMIPKSMLNGDVSIQVDGQQATVNPLENSTVYFFYLDYPAGSHSITIMGGLPSPEFGQFILIVAVGVPALLLRARRVGSSRRISRTNSQTAR
jgi:pimeloyl-ACP methyl ester carboxylesterase